MRKDLISRELFGNEAGEDELPVLLNSYFVEKGEFSAFYDRMNLFQVVKSKKGVGKSTLLKKTLFLKENESENFLCAYLKGADIEPFCNFAEVNPNKYINTWQQAICSITNYLLGSKLNLSWGGDELDIISESELMGFRKRNLFNTLLKRYEVQIQKSFIKVKDEKNTNNFQVLKNFNEQKELKIWLFIDDIDATFINNEKNKLILSTFFSACRKVTTDITGLYIRTSIRTDVWTIISNHDEALDKCEQYIMDLSWNLHDFNYIMRKKIKSYFVRNYNRNEHYKNYSLDGDARELLGLIFYRSFRIGERLMKVLIEKRAPKKVKKAIKSSFDKDYSSEKGLLNELRKKIEPEIFEQILPTIIENIHSKPLFYFYNHPRSIEKVIYRLSNGRPRWAAQLCRMAGQAAYNRDTSVSVIHNRDFRKILPDYSKNRLSGLIKEHKHQCKDLAKIIDVFSHSNSRYPTEVLYNLIQHNYVDHFGMPVIDQHEAKSIYDIIGFLFRIGLIQHFKPTDEQNIYESFEDRPGLIHTISRGVSENILWAVHISYIDALRISQSDVIGYNENKNTKTNN